MKIVFSGSRRVSPSQAQIFQGKYSACNAKDGFRGKLEILVGDCPTGSDKAITDMYGSDGGSFEVYRADWDQHGKAAGPMRNQEMINDADALVAFPCPQSKGTWDAIRKAVKKGIPVVIIPLGVE